VPFKSKAQRRKFAQLLVEGEITPETYEEWNRATGTARLPERVKPKKKRAAKKKRVAKRVGAKKRSASRRATRRPSRRKVRTRTRKK